MNNQEKQETTLNRIASFVSGPNYLRVGLRYTAAFAFGAAAAKFVIIPLMAAFTGAAGNVPDDQCYISGSIDLTEQEQTEGISNEFLFLALMEHGKRTSDIGQALYESNAEHRIERCYINDEDQSPGYYSPSQRRIVINFAGDDDNLEAARVKFDAGEYGADGRTFPVGDLEYEEAFHAYQYAEFDLESLREELSPYDLYLTHQALEAQAKVIKRAAMGPSSYALEVREEYGQRGIDYLLQIMGESMAVPATLTFCNEAGQDPNYCMTRAFSSFFEFHSAAYMYNDAFLAMRDGTDADEAKPLDVDAFNRIFGSIPGQEGSFLSQQNFNPHALHPNDHGVVTQSVLDITNVLKCVSDPENPQEIEQCSPNGEAPAWSQSFGYLPPNFKRGG